MVQLYYTSRGVIKSRLRVSCSLVLRVRKDSPELCGKEGIYCRNATQVKTKLDKATVHQFFKAVARVSTDINDKFIITSKKKRKQPIGFIASPFKIHMPNKYIDHISISKNGHPIIKDWADYDLVNTKD